MFGAFSITQFCSGDGVANILQLIGWILTVVKIAIPVIIVALGIFDLGKAVVSSKDDEIKAGAKRLLWRAIAGICIFFIPSIVLWLFQTVSDEYSQHQGDFGNCRTCVLSPWDCDIARG